MNADKSIEQICRDLLDKAIADGIVTFNAGNFVQTQGPQELTAGDLAGMANILAEHFREAIEKRDAKWQMAVGMPLEVAEEMAESLKVDNRRGAAK